MGYPASGVEGVYRNHIDEVCRLLEEKHKDHYLVYNLSGRKYDSSKFHDNVLELGWPDHHSPPLHILFDVCTSMHAWLTAHEDNVVVVHCIAGKGRTGVVISSYLLWSKAVPTTKDALAYFGRMRSERGVGVEYPSQQRVVGYFEQAIKTSRKRAPKAKELVLSKIIVHGVPMFDKDIGGCHPVVHVMKAPIQVDGKEKGETIYRSPWEPSPASPAQETLEFDVDRLCKGDVLLRFYHCPLLTQTFGGSGPTAKLMFRFAFHTFFVEDRLFLTQKEVDVANQEKHAKKFPPNFAVEILLQPPKPDRDYSKDSTLNLVPKVRKEGWLWKQGKYHTAFKKRWFYLNDNFLDYYRNKKDAKSAGSIPLSHVRLYKLDKPLDERDHCLALETPDRTYIVSAETTQDLHEWTDALCKSITAYSNSVGPPVSQEEDGQDPNNEYIDDDQRSDHTAGSAQSPATSPAHEPRPKLAAINPLARELLG
eukprot:c19856_g1_i5.p1 GENE.c19856_g1_i5~~c19856_g1_i5.p1  ORF type:complete len:479 (-),score=84.70 c19856_g1_i5:245-1681(-)